MNEFDDLENTLAAELRRRSGEVLGTDDLAARARRKARVVRRRRAVAVAGVTAVALAIAVPAALSLRTVPQTHPADPPTTSESPAPPPAPSETPSPDPTTPPPTTSTTPPVAPPVVETDEPVEPEQPAVGGTTEPALDGMPTGAPPAIGWMEGRTFHRTDGRSATIPAGYYAALELDNGFMASNESEVAFLAADGSLMTFYQGAGPVLSPDGFLVAYYNEEESEVWAGQADGDGTGPGSRDVPADQRLEPIGFLDDDYALVSNISTEEDRWAGIRIDSFAPGDPTPPVTPPWDLVRVSAVSASAGLVVGQTEITDSASCSAVYETDAAEPLWETCEYMFEHFSPNGAYLIGSRHYWDGEGRPYAVVVDARTGEVVHTYEGMYISELAFEDDEHLLLSVRLEDGADRLAALVRCDFAGSCELATPIDRVSWDDWAYGIGLQRW